MEKISVRVGGPFAGRHGCSLCKSDAGSDVWARQSRNFNAITRHSSFSFLNSFTFN
jgi:hypothetical protein